MEIEGQIRFRNNQVYVFNGHNEVSLFTWLASWGLKDKEVKIKVERLEND